MALPVENVLQANLTLVGVKLVNTPDERLAFRKAVDTEVATSETGLVGSDEIVERTHVLSRDRIVVTSNIAVTSNVVVTGNVDRTVIAREYPEKIDLERLAQVALMAIVNTNLGEQKLVAVGYNIELICESDSKDLAFQYLADHLFASHIHEESPLTGGAGRLFFEKSGHRWQARLEPRFNDENTTKIFVSLNMQRTGFSPSLPTKNEVKESLKLIWDEVHNLLSRLERRSV